MSDANGAYPSGGDGEPSDEIVSDSPPGTVTGLKIVLPSGATFPVLDQLEIDYMRDRIERYLSDNRFTNISDLADLDKILVNEMFIFRWQYWCSTGFQYNGEEVTARASLQKMIGDYSREIRLLKEQLGVDKTSRDRAKGDESLADYLLNLPIRAKEFGVHRNEQVAMIYELGMNLIGLLTFHDNADEDERRELGITREDLFQWIRDVFKPSLEALDDKFRQEQRIWIRGL